MKWTAVGIILALALTVLAGCGKNASTGNGSSAGNGTPAAGDSTASGNGQSTGDSKVTVKIGADTTFPPFESQVNGKLVGFDIDLITAIAEKENLTPKFSTMNFTGLIPAIQTGQIDVAVAGITIKKSRMAAVNFSNAYYKSGLSILVKKELAGSVKSLADLKGKTVATKKGTSSVDLVQSAGGIKLRQFDNIDDAYNELLNGGAAAVVFDNPVNTNFMKSHDQVQTVGDLLTGEYYGFAVNKDNADLLKKINDGLDQVRKDGTYDKLFQQYFGDTPGKVTDVVAPSDAALDD
ncbi:basic amino acid ABC transporter substrate-binding protein [Paenibacillus humicola]|uniref:basic amino acid ABC transporter substrate-binding protein n=1 Tax=Paenibacillus humicola TaxID=3110540 RepID=UPI00237A7B77|nr:basic amino acid ABC transporter substrate-binding protein [Paenibacillus humicola]